MPGFLREHAGSILGSIALHAALLGLLAGAAWVAWPERSPPLRTIAAYVVHAPEPARAARPAPVAEPTVEPAREPAPETVPDPAPVPEPTPPAPEPSVPDPAELAREARAREAAEREARRRVEAQLAARREAEAEAEAKRRDERQRREAEERRQAEARKREEAERRLRADAERRLNEAREADLAARLAQEDRRAGAQAAGLLDRYVFDLTARIERAWHRPPTARPGLRCTVYVVQVPGGVVTDARVGECNGDDAVQRSIVAAVYRASPLPAPPDPTLFDRRLRIEFVPED